MKYRYTKKLPQHTNIHQNYKCDVLAKEWYECKVEIKIEKEANTASVESDHYRLLILFSKL
jgi:hypothetical protein